MTRHSLIIGVLTTVFAVGLFLTAPAVLASTQIIVPPGFNCTTDTQNPHPSGHLDGTVSVVGQATGCTEVVSRLTITVDLVIGAQASGYIIADSSTTYYNTDGLPASDHEVNASDACSAFGPGSYSAKTVGTFVYNGATGAVRESQVPEIDVSCSS